MWAVAKSSEYTCTNPISDGSFYFHTGSSAKLEMIVASGSLKLNQVTVGVVPIEESISVGTGVEFTSSTAALSSPHRLRLMGGALPTTAGSAGFCFFVSGLLIGVKEDGGGNTALVGASTFTIPLPDATPGPFFLGTLAGVGARAGVAIGFAPYYRMAGYQC